MHTYKGKTRVTRGLQIRGIKFELEIEDQKKSQCMRISELAQKEINQRETYKARTSKLLATT